MTEEKTPTKRVRPGRPRISRARGKSMKKGPPLMEAEARREQFRQKRIAKPRVVGRPSGAEPKGLPQVTQLESRIRELNRMLAVSAPRSEFESMKRDLEGRMEKLEAKLDQSVPRETANYLRAKVQDLDSRLANSIRRQEAQAAYERTLVKLRKEVTILQQKVAASVPAVASREKLLERMRKLQEGLAQSVSHEQLRRMKAEAEARSKKLIENARKLEEQLAKSVPREQLESAKTQAEAVNRELSERLSKLESRLAEAVPMSDLEAMRQEAVKRADELKGKVGELVSKLAGLVPRSELDSAKAEAKSRIQELEEKLAKSRTEAETLSEKVTELQAKLGRVEAQLEAKGTQPSP